MLRTISIAIAVSIHLLPVCFASQPKVLWRRSIFESSIFNKARDLAVDSHGNAIVATENAPKDSSAGYIQKYNPDGKLLWEFELASVYPESRSNKVYAVTVDTKDFIYYTGYANHPHEQFQQSDAYYSHFCFGKLSPSGELIDSYRHEKRNKASECFDMAIGQEFLAVGGYVNGGFSTKHRETSGTFIAVIDYDLKIRRRIDDDKTKTPLTNYARGAGPGSKIVTGVGFTSDGGLMVTGRVAKSGDYHRYLQRRNKKLGAQWTVRLNNHGSRSEWPAVAIDSTDATYVAMSSEAATRDASPDQIYIVKYSPDGNLLWEKTVRSSSKSDVANRMAVASDDSIIIACKYNDRAAIARISSSGTMSQKPYYLYPSKISMSGVAQAVAIANDGAVYAVGKVVGQMAGDGDVIGGNLEKEPKGGGPWTSYDEGVYAFLVKLSPGSSSTTIETSELADRGQPRSSGSLADFASSVLSDKNSGPPPTKKDAKKPGLFTKVDALIEQLHQEIEKARKRAPSHADAHERMLADIVKERKYLGSKSASKRPEERNKTLKSFTSNVEIILDFVKTAEKQEF